jgi:hypothetical protein
MFDWQAEDQRDTRHADVASLSNDMCSLRSSSQREIKILSVLSDMKDFTLHSLQTLHKSYTVSGETFLKKTSVELMLKHCTSLNTCTRAY